jgi:plastocyanin
MSTMQFCSMCRREVKPGEEATWVAADRVYHTACLAAGMPVKFGSGKPVPTPPAPAPILPVPGFADRRGRAEYLRQLKLKGEIK